ncbi:LOW QUALITY PROTEIN: hypothetical protein Smp_161210 [Schistosoma mansoni]|uniref:hypothetical protein n=1 Tax=Schistosoma mansoni TaxID=6183 RepID=UPI00022DC7FE|nr:LOW QUALITY PROTEIN: hypothetical protein Smp_161210 [Schistosoma mansoni]|eukprot:XP_018650378.1 LOW QUALITY PROTEIN: hypothetical protein Smp_161210 [Schistosoma mansoni]
MQSTEYSTSSTTDFTTASTFSQSLTESIPTNDTYMITTESYYNIVTSSLKDTLSTLTTLSIHHDHTTVYSEFACVRSELSEPDFQLYACSGSKITSWIASIFLVTMSIFGIIKCLTAHGILNIFDLRRTGISFPKRPEFFVLTCSSLPLIGGSKKNCGENCKNITQTLKQPVGRGRTSEWGYTDKRRKSRSSKSVRGTTETVAATPNSSSINTLTNTNEINDPTSQVANSGGINLISAQPLFIDQNNVLGPPNQLPGMMPNLSGLMNPYGQMIPQNMMVTPDNYNMFNNGPVGQQLGQQANPYAMNMGYGMGYGMTMNMNNYINQVNAYNQPNFMYPMNGAISPDIPKDTINNTINNDKPPINDTSEKVSTIKTRSKIEVPLPTKQFLYHCKRIIPGCIYIISFIITLPSITAFEPIEEDGMILTRCTTMCRSYFYYDLVVLVTMPTISLIIAFYYSSLSKKQINGELKMTYRLRCYYVTFILLNIPMFVLMLTSIGFRLSEKPYRNIYGTGILIAMTAYHTNFALKSTIYTTGCNCICCSDYCLMKYPKINRLIISFTTPVAIKDKEALLEGIVIPVRMDK